MYEVFAVVDYSRFSFVGFFKKKNQFEQWMDQLIKKLGKTDKKVEHV